jgi:hypothetical protein
MRKCLTAALPLQPAPFLSVAARSRRGRPRTRPKAGHKGECAAAAQAGARTAAKLTACQMRVFEILEQLAHASDWRGLVAQQRASRVVAAAKQTSMPGKAAWVYYMLGAAASAARRAPQGLACMGATDDGRWQCSRHERTPRAVALRVGRAQDPHPAATACAALSARRVRGIVAPVRCATQLLAARSGVWLGRGGGGLVARGVVGSKAYQSLGNFPRPSSTTRSTW